MVSEQVAHVVERLSRAVPALRTRAMFGGTGLYSGTLFFGLIATDVLYLAVDDASRAEYVSRGMPPFQPFPDKPSMLSYYELPADVLDDARKLRAWAEKAQIAARAKATRRSSVRSAKEGKSAGTSKTAKTAPKRAGRAPVELASIGATSRSNLASIGVRTRAELGRKGVVETFLALREQGCATTRNLLFALEGERTGLRADQLPESVKADLLRRAARKKRRT